MISVPRPLPQPLRDGGVHGILILGVTEVQQLVEEDDEMAKLSRAPTL